MDGGWGMGWEAIDGSQFNLVEGNFIKGAGQLVSFFKPSIEVSAANNTVRRNIMANGKYAALEVSALYAGSSVANSQIYNNVFYDVGGCYFQSRNGGVSAYDGVLFANNICYKFRGNATDIYLDNKTSQIAHNTVLSVDANGKPQPDKNVIIWNHAGQANFEYAQTLAFADSTYNPPFFNNKALALVPGFVDEANLDFHLGANSPLINAGMQITGRQWGSPKGSIDLGAFGINGTPRVRQVTNRRSK
jgi:hypothetical protein